MRELEHLLPDLEPPPGGLAQLQRNMRTPRKPARRHAWRWLPATAGACALLSLVQAMPDARAIALAAQALSVVALALLGPGAYSMDALFFGRRIVRIDE